MRCGLLLTGTDFLNQRQIQHFVVDENFIHSADNKLIHKNVILVVYQPEYIRKIIYPWKK